MQPLTDTIVAPITAAGDAERSAVRLSGTRALELAADVLQLAAPMEAGRLTPARLPLGDGVHADVTLLCFRAPRSFTGEDVVEVHLAGWPVLVQELVARLVAAGARPAERGEFSRRALILGRRDLAQTLALGRLAAARDAEEAAAAAAALTGELAARHAQLRARLLDTLALIEAHVDFEEDDTEAVREDDVRAGLLRARTLATELARDCARAPSADGETDLVLLGAPNAGKSQLFLALCPGAHTTVSPVAGTTRDALEARVLRDGRAWRVLDGPGIDEPDPDTPAAPRTALERRAMEAFVAQIPALAVVLHVDDATTAVSAATARRLLLAAGARPAVRVLNKCDLLEDPSAAQPEPAGGPLRISALMRTGIDELWRAVAAAAPAPRAPDLAGRAEALAAAVVLPLLEEALAAPLSGALPVVALALRAALEELDGAEPGDEALGEEVLDRIFASFCIGK